METKFVAEAVRLMQDRLHELTDQDIIEKAKEAISKMRGKMKRDS